MAGKITNEAGREVWKLQIVWEYLRNKLLLNDEAPKKNEYLNLVLNLMRGPSTKNRIGLVPRKFLNLLIRDKIVDYNLKHTAPTYVAGSMVSALDYGREHIIKPIYQKTPVSFKLWFDKIRYHA